jgi:acetoacetyl-CoA reductase
LDRYEPAWEKADVSRFLFSERHSVRSPDVRARTPRPDVATAGAAIRSGAMSAFDFSPHPALTDGQMRKWDVGDYDACARGLDAVTGELGAVDILVNNAGITRDATLHKMTREQWDDVIRVDLTSAFNLCRLTIDGMRERNHGRIINISSINGQKGQVGQVNYSAAKAGLIGFTKALALENARKGVTVNVICPGYIDTEMVAAVPAKVLESIIATIPVGRLGKAEEIAACVSFLAGSDAGFITGATLTANGGQFIAG